MHPENAKARRWLIEGLQRHLLPSLVQQGFKLAPSETIAAPVDRRYVRAFPLGELVRARESRVDRVSIQFATHDRNAFRINARVEPPKEIMNHERLPPVPGFLARGLSEHFEMYASPKLWAWFTWGWFSVRRSPFRATTQSDYENLTKLVAGFERELELALREGILGPHMRRVSLPYYVPTKS
jgi:hypothetical protein